MARKQSINKWKSSVVLAGRRSGQTRKCRCFAISLPVPIVQSSNAAWRELEAPGGRTDGDAFRCILCRRPSHVGPLPLRWLSGTIFLSTFFSHVVFLASAMVFGWDETNTLDSALDIWLTMSRPRSIYIFYNININWFLPASSPKMILPCRSTTIKVGAPFISLFVWLDALFSPKRQTTNQWVKYWMGDLDVSIRRGFASWPSRRVCIRLNKT
jgi:hypothetical protein